MIIFVGDKPSAKNKDPNVPFVGTKSYKKLLEWIWEMDIDISKVHMMNAENWWKYTPKCGLRPEHKYIVLGKNAETKFKQIKTIHGDNHCYFKIDHPSGLNRKLNDKKYVKKMLKECREWLNE